MRGRPHRGFVRRHRLLLGALLVSMLLGYLSQSALTATLVVNSSRVYDRQHTIDPLVEMLPSQCGAVQGIVNVATGATYGLVGAGNSDLYIGNQGAGTTINAGGAS